MFSSHRVETFAKCWRHLSYLSTPNSILSHQICLPSKGAEQKNKILNYLNHHPFHIYFMSVWKIKITKNFSKKKHLCPLLSRPYHMVKWWRCYISALLSAISNKKWEKKFKENSKQSHSYVRRLAEGTWPLGSGEVSVVLGLEHRVPSFFHPSLYSYHCLTPSLMEQKQLLLTGFLVPGSFSFNPLDTLFVFPEHIFTILFWKIMNFDLESS